MAWAVSGDVDARAVVSNSFEMSGRRNLEARSRSPKLIDGYGFPSALRDQRSSRVRPPSSMP